MKVVLDSNIIIADFWLKSTNFKILFESSNKGDIQVYIPEVVLDEVINKYGERLIKVETFVSSELKTFNKLINSNVENPITLKTINDAISGYEQYIKSLIKDRNITILKYPNVDHKYIAGKAIKKLKPFNVNEKGYRDSLIWENIKELLTDYESVPTLPELVFITDNHKDFANKENELHQDLTLELENEDYEPESVIIYGSLNEFNEKQVKLFFVQSKSFEKKLKNNDIWNFDLHSVVVDYLQKNYVEHEFDQELIDLEDEINDPTVRGISEEFEIDIKSVKKLNAQDYLVDINFEVETEIDFFIDKHEYWSLEDSSISIEDSNWNKWVMLASTILDVPISMSIILDLDFKTKSMEINNVSGYYK